MGVVWVGLGGMIGAISRHAVVVLAASRLGTAFPYGTFAVNLIGSFAIGVLASVLLWRDSDPFWRMLLITGFLGGFTTFSSFSLEMVALLQDGRWGRAVTYFLGSNLIGIGACAAGLALGRTLVR